MNSRVLIGVPSTGSSVPCSRSPVIEYAPTMAGTTAAAASENSWTG